MQLIDRNGLPVWAVPSWRPGRDHLARTWSGIGRRALREMRQSVAVHVYDPECGATGSGGRWIGAPDIPQGGELIARTSLQQPTNAFSMRIAHEGG
ncbi:hypothetical protein [Streptomyces hydrogenans]|uniref:hypothetical protein n=1 Tax=Streptomyces hydrogenans TaxID=1873719 RepID=UPI0035DE6F02